MSKNMRKYWPLTDWGRTLHPSFDDVWDKFSTRYFHASGPVQNVKFAHVLTKLLPKRPLSASDASRLHVAFDDLANNVQTARGKLQGKSTAVQTLAGDWLNDYKSYTRMVKQWRLSDISKHYLKFVRKILISKGLNGGLLQLLPNTPILDPAGNPIPDGKQKRVPVTYKEPDWEETYKAIKKKGKVVVDQAFKDDVRSGAA